MKGNTWIIQDGLFEVVYSIDGQIMQVNLSLDNTPASIDWFFRKIAVAESREGGIKEFMNELKAKGKKVVEVPSDISFDRFYDQYGNKVGRQRAERAWIRMPKAEKVKALMGIKKYKAHSNTKKYDLAYPARYLNDKLYNDFQ